ncbi:hypothetical protein DWB61_09175 [Ancylomarina euxinus]|uniref:Cyclic nucleotide-binding domain-containing protein n=1 Tax=Ancylomarina euxinus TaxID=2283627 RepID=A0A425Y237_9BACT|nr:cyclic nucleotide-gated ion channel [Ancylomarina euxinus]MCZ4695040.1 cyclic nucleotide-binding domain-containing protein [Ancylomarina euxinus]MUP15024.1 cyclic nucleotide-binding domain-containing protein [Ancylomarina euxinus]RRG21911.1 hypothetical protein DWB61_09175 [Ancylomarina euxinus]
MIIKPRYSKFDTAWRILVILTVLVQATLLPLDFLFELRFQRWYDMLDLVITVIYLLDFGENMHRYKRIQKHAVYKDIYWDTYSSGKFFISDVLAILPYAFLFSHPAFQFLRMFKWVKVLRTMHFFQIRNIRNTTRSSLWFLLIGTFLVAHWFSCIWLRIHGFEADISHLDNYIKALYYIVTTLTSVGYGDIVPNGNAEMLFNILLQLTGVGLIAFLVGSVVGLFTKRNPAEQRFTENMEKLRALIHYHDIPSELEKRISDYFTYEWKQKLGYDESELMESLPFGLKNDLQLEFKNRTIKHISIFEGVDEKFVREIALYLTPIVLTPGDYLFRTGDVANSMFFVKKGKISVLTEDEKQELTILKSGDFMGEIALFKKSNRTATVKSIGYSDIYELHKKEFEKVIKKYPDIALRIKEKSISREQRYI